MNFSNIKLPIGIIGIIVAQAFGIIWYVAQMDSTVSSLNESMIQIQKESHMENIVVLERDVAALQETINDMADADDLYKMGITIASLQQKLDTLESIVKELETKDALIDNEMRTIMGDHNGFNDVLKTIGISGYGDTRTYGGYDTYE